MPNELDHRIDALNRQYRQDNNLDPVYAIVGKVTSAGNYLYDTSVPGNVFVRVLTSNGLGGAISVRGPEQNMTLYIGLNVKLERDSRGQLYIKGVDNQAQYAGGANPYITSQPPQNRVRQDFIETLSVLPDSPPSLYLTIKAWNPIVNGTYYEFPGTRVYMGPYVPPTGSMNYAGLFLKTDYLTGEVGTSTARATSDLPLDKVDVQEVVNLRSAGATPVQVIKLIGGQGTISLTDIQNDGKPIQQLVNVADSTGGGGGSGIPLTVKEAHGTLVVHNVGTLAINGTLTDLGGGSVDMEVAGGGGGGGGTVTPTYKTINTEVVLYDNTLSSAGTWDVSSIDQTYDHLIIRAFLLETRNGGSYGTDVQFIFNNDSTGANYKEAQAGGYVSGAFGSTNTAPSAIFATDTTGSNSNAYTTFEGIIQNYTGNKFKQIVGYMGARNTSTDDYVITRAVTWQSTAAINRIGLSVPQATTTFEAGSRLQIIGIKAQTLVSDVTGSSVGTAIAVTTADFKQETVLYSNTLSGDGSWDVTSLSGAYDELRVRLRIRSAAAAAVDNGYVYFNNDTTDANYDSQNVYGNNGTPFAGNAVNRLPLTIVGDTQNANLFTPVEIILPGYADTGKYKGYWNIANEIADAAGNSYSVLTSSVWKSTSAISRITIKSASGTSGNFKSGSTIEIVGVKTQTVVTSATGGNLSYPKRATMWHDEALVTAGNALDINHDTAQNYATWSRQNTPSASDKFTNSFMLRAGTFTLSALGVKGNNAGKLDWYIDGSSVVTGEDWYAGSTTNNVIQTHSSIVVPTDGYHTLEGRVNGKNGSSSDYYILLTKYWLTPASD